MSTEAHNRKHISNLWYVTLEKRPLAKIQIRSACALTQSDKSLLYCDGGGGGGRRRCAFGWQFCQCCFALLLQGVKKDRICISYFLRESTSFLRGVQESKPEIANDVSLVKNISDYLPRNPVPCKQIRRHSQSAFYVNLYWAVIGPSG